MGMPVSAIILCGGRSERMGRDKAGLPFGPEPLLARVARLVGQVADDVVLVAREGQALPDGFEAGARDAAEGLGPLAGIAAGLAAVRHDRAVVVACDMPLVRPALLRRLIDLSQGHDACVPVIDGFRMTTCAVYTKSAGVRAAEMVAHGELTPADWIDALDTRVVDEGELLEVDPELDSFKDCNTPDAYAWALKRAGFPAPAVGATPPAGVELD